MPRVLRIINRLNLGGPTYNVANLTKFMAPEFETLLVSGMRDETEESSEHIIDDLGLKPLYIEEMYREINPFKDFKSYKKLREIIADFKPDIVHTHAAKSGAVGRLAALHAGVPVVIHTFHGHVFHSYFGKAKTRAFLSIEKFLGKRCTAIIALSEIQKRELAEVFNVAPIEKFHVVPLGFNLSKFSENVIEKRKRFRAEWNIQDDEVVIGIVGRLVPVKNHTLFIQAFHQLLSLTTKKVRAFIIGDGEDRDKIERMLTLYNISFSAEKDSSASVVFTSWLKDIDVSNAGMDIIALSSLNEGTPVSLIEAQASSKPIVSTRVGGIANIVEEGKSALLSESGDVDGFAKNLATFVNDNSLRLSMSGYGKHFVMENYSHLRLARDMSHLYNKLLKEKGII